MTARAILISETMGSSGYVPFGTGAWYGAQELLAAVGLDWVVAWRRRLAGPPALVPGRSDSLGSSGVVLPNNQLFWAGWDTNDAYKVWVDLATGAVLPVPVKRTLEGACRP